MKNYDRSQKGNLVSAENWRRIALGFPRVIGFFNIEAPLYYILEKRGNKEIRDYKSYLSVYTEISGLSYEDAITIGFWKLFDYFSFNNLGERDLKGDATGADRAVKMTLTSPVFEINNGNKWTVSMMVPAKYSMDTVPLPVDPDVHIARVPERVVAVIESPGVMSVEKVELKTRKLEEWLRKLDKFTISSRPFVAHQDLFPTFQFLRKTEIHIQVERSE
tara:strand:+ start:6757 stop:7413 length:657 start_codon:yes stop_codon:yes gene_type:complete